MERLLLSTDEEIASLKPVTKTGMYMQLSMFHPV
jgi:hypothetical protein